jgi:hypothetical protein
VAASVAANILHARQNPISQTIAAWPPCALLLTIELISRVPMHRRSLAVARLGATAAIAGIAAWVSYWHMAGVAARYGESHTSAYLMPLSVDGLIMVASVSLVELAGRIRTVEEQNRTEQERRAALEAAFRPPAPVRVEQPLRTESPVRAESPLSAESRVRAESPVSAESPVRTGGAPALADAETVRALAAKALAAAGMPTTRETAPAARDGSPAAARGTSAVTTRAPDVRPAPARPAPGQAAPGWIPIPHASSAATPAQGGVPRQASPARLGVRNPQQAVPANEQPTNEQEAGAPGSADPQPPAEKRQRRPVAETAALASAIEAMHPDMSQTELARQLGISPSRLRAIRREVRELERVS